MIALDLQRSIQSALHPASDAAGAIHQLTLVLTVGACAILVLVLALAACGALSGPRKVSAGAWVIGGGIVFPVIVLAALLVHALRVGHALSAPPARPAEIEVTGKTWWWEIRYLPPGARALPGDVCTAATRAAWEPPGDGAATAVLANEIYIPVGRPVEIALKSDNVIHSFWVPALAGKVDMIPGRTTRIVVQAREPGVYRGQCAEYCGIQHSWMAFYVVAVPNEEYEQWLAKQAAPAREPEQAFLREGRDAFLSGGCAACHTVRGTPAAGTLGPDLTHVGGRRSIAAGRLDNHAGTLAGWIADPQSIKPGNLMPPTTVYTGEQLRAVAAWLESLK
jgi:cytochrome c oxidase subunit 2